MNCETCGKDASNEGWYVSFGIVYCKECFWKTPFGKALKESWKPSRASKALLTSSILLLITTIASIILKLVFR